MNIPFIDSHAHLNLMPETHAPREVYERAMLAGLEALVNVGTDLERSRESVRLAQELPGVFATVGIHPSEAHLWNETVLAELESLLFSPGVVAIGETGLDFSYPEPSREDQERSFRGQIALAYSRDLPLVIHCRDAFDTLFQILDTSSLPSRPGVLHCFTGDRKAAERALEMGFYLSFSGILTFRNAQQLREVAQAVPEDRILVETDCPYLAPVPYRGKTNEPAYLPETLSVLTLVRESDPLVLARTIRDNTRTLFSLPALD
ncbi:MAG: TatD family hydrolase [Leptospirales bacterium]